jgi:hypothetical protein
MNRCSPYAAIAVVLEISPVESLYEKADAVKLSASKGGEAEAAATKRWPAIVARARNV